MTLAEVNAQIAAAEAALELLYAEKAVLLAPAEPPELAAMNDGQLAAYARQQRSAYARGEITSQQLELIRRCRAARAARAKLNRPAATRVR